MSFHPYLFFSDGRCREAFTRYQQVFGGDLSMMTFGDVPDGGEMPDVDPNQVMHATLRLGDGRLMGSDDPTGDGGPHLGIAVSHSVPDVDTGRNVFEALSEGGEVQMPFEPTFWSAGFGSCLDRFGISWMVDVDHGAAT